MYFLLTGRKIYGFMKYFPNFILQIYLITEANAKFVLSETSSGFPFIHE